MIRKLLISFGLMIFLLSLVFAFTSNASYGDIVQPSYYADEAYFCAHNGIIHCSSTSSFSPGSNITRGDAMYGITHALGLSPSNSVNTGFTDVPSGSIYAGSVKWAVDNGVTAGIGNNQFGLSNSITREQFCVFFYKACQAGGVTLPNLRTFTSSSFSDYSSVHSYGQIPIKELYEAELIEGFTDGTLGPNETMTRAQASVQLFKLYSLKHYNDSAIKVFVRDENGVPINNAHVYVYYLNTNTSNNGSYENYVTSNSKGLAVKSSSVNTKYALNTFCSNYYQGVSDTILTKSVYPSIIVMKAITINPYKPPIKTMDPHSNWTSTRSYLSSWQNYGWRYGTNNQLEFHQGVDYGYTAGTTVYSICGGKVVMSKFMSGTGNIVQIKDVYNTYIIYQHLHTRYVLNGDDVYPVETYTESTSSYKVIGTVGNTGGNYGYHLHISFAKDSSVSTARGTFSDPIPRMKHLENNTFVSTPSFY